MGMPCFKQEPAYASGFLPEVSVYKKHGEKKVYNQYPSATGGEEGHPGLFGFQDEVRCN